MARMSSGLTQLAENAGLPVQVAAVCYRIRELSIEFLLVNTSSGKWTFPKGRIEPSLTGSESAALEAWEEAGAKGRIEEDFFGAYLDSKRALGHDSRTREVMIAAYLFEVETAVQPQEAGRNPRWFTPQQAKRQLAAGRTSRYSVQIARVVNAAVEKLTAHHPRMRTLLIAAETRRRAASAR